MAIIQRGERTERVRVKINITGIIIIIINIIIIIAHTVKMVRNTQQKARPKSPRLRILKQSKDPNNMGFKPQMTMILSYVISPLLLNMMTNSKDGALIKTTLGPASSVFANMARKSRRTLQNKVRIKVFPIC